MRASTNLIMAPSSRQKKLATVFEP